MKRKIALLLAVIMVLALLPVTASAATDNVTVNTLSVGSNTLLFDAGSEYGLSANDSLATTQAIVPINDRDSARDDFGLEQQYIDGLRNIARGTNLVIPFKSDVLSDYQFKLQLGNAKWYLAYDNTTTVADRGTITNRDGNTLSGPGAVGAFYERTNDGEAVTTGVGSAYTEADYTLEVSALDSSVAIITIKAPVLASELKALNIPLLVWIADGTVDATVSIVSGSASTISSQKLIFAVATKSSTVSSIQWPATAYDTFGGKIVIRELRPATIRPGAKVNLYLPEGFYWSFNGSDLSYSNSSGAYHPIDNGNSGYESGISTDNTAGAGNNITRVNIWPGTDIYDNDKLGTITPTVTDNRRKVTIELPGNFEPSSTLAGALYISGLRAIAEENAPFGDFSVVVEGQYLSGVTNETIKFGTRVDWGVTLTAGTAPTIVSGRYIGPTNNEWEDGSTRKAINDVHKTARVTLKENVVNSWWKTRKTVLSLPVSNDVDIKGAKFRKVKVYLFKDNGVAVNEEHIIYNNDNIYRDGTNTWNRGFTLTENSIIMNNLSLNGGQTAKVEFDIWVSVEYGFGKQTGDLLLSVDPVTTGIVGEFPDPVVIAKVIEPVEVATKITDLKIGYQYQAVADIQIKENAKGALLRGKTVKLSITDYVSASFLFSPYVQIKVTEGDLKINNISTSSSNGFTTQSGGWLSSSTNGSQISFDIEAESKTASTITISNAGVQLDRSVPVTNKESLQLIVWGTAIAENYGLYDNEAQRWYADFNTVGDIQSYINVVSTAPDQSGILSNEVKFFIGEAYYTVTGTTVSMDV
ncbi:MAG: hypothetical protein LBT59_17790, partial [Clostridiales bacterium]|nr:hypothetical protein [Clostridiales bacterium]